MIRYQFETAFRLRNQREYTNWLIKVAKSEGRVLEDINYIFTSDTYLLELNQRFLNHDYYTDILTFDYSVDRTVSGDIFISIDRVMENARSFGVDFDEELLRVMVHGLLHLFGYNDDDDMQQQRMRSIEDEKIKLFHVEQ
jgi:rRNA maturation RNase YbeY